MSLFSSSLSIEKELEKLYVPMFAAMTQTSETTARESFYIIIKQIKEEQIREGTDKLPKNYGDYLLEKESADERIKTSLNKKRKEGVKNEDIKWWFNMHDIERRMLLKIDDITRMAMFKKYKEDGKSGEEAVNEIRRYQPFFGNPDDNTNTSGEDRPLPYELKDRINKHGEKHASDPEKFKLELLKYSSMNAYVREQIRNRNL